MAAIPTPSATVRGSRGIVASADQLATQAGVRALDRGGNAVDAALATNAAMTVVAPHLCGLGGDLFALVYSGGQVHGLNASGRAGSGADPAALRSEGATAMPFRHDVRSVTVPGCVDGWMALHERFATLSLAELLEPAISLASNGFPASPLLVGAIARLDDAGRNQLANLTSPDPRSGARLRLPLVAQTLQRIADGGRDEFYGGPFGTGLEQLGAGLFTTDDVTANHADWVPPLRADAFGVELHTIGPNTQGYLTLAAARLATAVGLPDDPDDPAWAHLLIECASAAGYDRPDMLHEHADGAALLTAIDQRGSLIDTDRASSRHVPGHAGDTTYLCTMDGDGMGVSLIQSNASGFGSWLAEPNTGINLHNRGLGFNLIAGHPAEFGPGRRPPHTLSPALATRHGELLSVFGTMGGDAQPQILLQIAARLFVHGHSPNRAIRAGRWALQGPVTGFDTWTAEEGPNLAVEGHTPPPWSAALEARGHRVETTDAYSSIFGHAHAIVVEPSGMLAGASDPRTIVGSCAAI